MNKSDLNKEISLLIKDLNYLRQNPRVTISQLEDLKKNLEELKRPIQTATLG